MKEQQKLIAAQKMQLELKQKEYAQKQYAQEMRLKEESQRIKDQQNELEKMQKLSFQKQKTIRKIEEEEEKKSEKSSLEDHYILEMGDIKIEKQIGAGGSAKVYKGIYKEIDVAVKRLDLNSIGVGKAKLEFKREVNTLNKIRHPNLVLFIGVAFDKTNFCIVTEF